MNEKHAAITMLLLVWNEPLRTFASHAQLDSALDFFRFGSSATAPPPPPPRRATREITVSVETYLLHTSFLLLSLYYLVLPPRDFYILGALYALFFWIGMFYLGV